MIWLQHVLVHAIPPLWRLHRLHHADLDVDLTPGARLHPIEIGQRMPIKVATISVFVPPVLAVVIVEASLNAAAILHQGIIRLPAAPDRVLRWFVVTPDRHRVHHSVENDETNAHVRFNLPWWNRLFGVCHAQPCVGHAQMIIGIHGHRDSHEVARLPGILMLPLRGEVEGCETNRRDRASPAGRQALLDAISSVAGHAGLRHLGQRGGVALQVTRHQHVLGHDGELAGTAVHGRRRSRCAAAPGWFPVIMLRCIICARPTFRSGTLLR